MPECPDCESRRVVSVEFCGSNVRVCIDCEWVSVPYGGPPPRELADQDVLDTEDDDVVWEAQ